ncbi:MAG: hypothetical protein WD049_04840 [Candidatus Paceibacterota bacterium]
MKHRRTRIIAIVILVLAVALLGWLFFGGSGIGEKQAVSLEEPAIVVLDFYDPWLAAVQATSTDPYKSDLPADPILSKELRDRLMNHSDRSGDGVDPVLCQERTPPAISARPVFTNDEQAQILVLSTRPESQGQAVVTLNKLNGGWYINDIECSSGEVAPDREFSFEQEGFLLKSVPPPLDSQYWHLVFEQNNEQGHTVPLFFGAESMCQTGSGTASVCEPDTFTEATQALVKGEMSETGVEVKRVEMKK